MLLLEKTIIKRLMGARYEDGKTGLTDGALKSHIITFMLAGHEVCITTTFIIHYTLPVTVTTFI